MVRAVRLSVGVADPVGHRLPGGKKPACCHTHTSNACPHACWWPADALFALFACGGVRCWRLQYTPVLVQEIVLVVLLTFTQVLVFSFLFGVLLHYIVKRDAEQVGLC